MSVYSESVGDQLTIDGQEIAHEEVVKGKTPPPLPAEVKTPEVTEQEVLDRAADLLEEFGWHQGSFARDSNGRSIFPWQPEAQSFCAVGALLRARRDLDGQFPLNDGEMADLMCWNDQDNRSREAVVLALRAGLPQFRSVA